MVVVVIITALSALAIPSILKQMRDRRTRQAAEEIASLYRQARLRALGRGSAVMVRYSSTTGFEMREAVLGGTNPLCARLPVSSCITAQWGQGQAVANGDQQISTFNPSGGVYTGVSVFASAAPVGGSGTTDPGTAVSYLDVCFTPMGRSLFGTAGGSPPPAVTPMTGVPVIVVSNTVTVGLKRVVFIPPNGLARLDVSQ